MKLRVWRHKAAMGPLGAGFMRWDESRGQVHINTIFREKSGLACNEFS